MRTVPIPSWVKSTVDAWTAAVAITSGPVFRAINKTGRIWRDGMSPKVLWDVVRAAAARAGSTSWPRTTCRAPAPVSAASPGAFSAGQINGAGQPHAKSATYQAWRPA